MLHSPPYVYKTHIFYKRQVSKPKEHLKETLWNLLVWCLLLPSVSPPKTFSWRWWFGLISFLISITFATTFTPSFGSNCFYLNTLSDESKYYLLYKFVLMSKIRKLNFLFCYFKKEKKFFNSGGGGFLTFTAHHCCMKRGNTARPPPTPRVYSFVLWLKFVSLEEEKKTRNHGFTWPHATLRKLNT